MSTKYERMKTEVSKFFPSCPLCQKETIETRFMDDYWARDYIVCSNCHAKWHIYFIQGLKWARLIDANVDGKGRDYLGIKYEPAFWFDMVEKKPAEKVVIPPSSAKEKGNNNREPARKRRR